MHHFVYISHSFAKFDHFFPLRLWYVWAPHVFCCCTAYSGSMSLTWEGSLLRLVWLVLNNWSVADKNSWRRVKLKVMSAMTSCLLRLFNTLQTNYWMCLRMHPACSNASTWLTDMTCLISADYSMCHFIYILHSFVIFPWFDALMLRFGFPPHVL